MANRRNIQFFYTPHNKATLCDCSFVVDSANGNGLGLRNLKPSGRVANVYMHTSATPAVGSPNPAAGLIVVQMQDNYNTLLGGSASIVSPLSGTPISAGLVVGQAYVIVSLGASSVAQWQAAGVLTNQTPQVGLAFIATATSVAGGGTVEAMAAAGSGIDHFETIGDSHLSNSTLQTTVGAGVGMQIILMCKTAGVTTAPADGTVLAFTFYFNDTNFGV